VSADFICEQVYSTSGTGSTFLQEQQRSDAIASEKMKPRNTAASQKVPQGEDWNVGDAKTDRKPATTAIAREERILKVLQSKRSHVYALFVHFAVSTIFDPITTCLQSEEPLVHKLRRLLIDLCKDILSKFVKVDAVVAAGDDVINLDCENAAIHKDDNEVMIGSAARTALDKRDADCKRQVIGNVKKFYITAFKYLTTKLPALQDEMFKHCEVADVTLRTTAKFSSVLYFVNRRNLIDVKEDATEVMDKLESQFLTYQAASDIPESDRTDIQWQLIGQVKDAKGQLKYDALARIMSVVLAIPRSNADCERVFSLVCKLRTESRASMSNETLESLVIQKVTSLHQGPCHSQQFSTAMIRSAKSATYHAISHDTD